MACYSLSFAMAIFIVTLLWMGVINCSPMGRIHKPFDVEDALGSSGEVDSQEAATSDNKIEDALASRILALLEKHEDAKAFQLLKTLYNHKRAVQYKKCVKLLAPSICKNSSPQPFHLWAQVAARAINDNAMGGIKDQLFARV